MKGAQDVAKMVDEHVQLHGLCTRLLSWQVTDQANETMKLIMSTADSSGKIHNIWPKMLQISIIFSIF